MIILLFLLLVSVGFVCLIALEIKKANIEFESRKASDLAWLEEQQKLSKYKVRIHIKDQSIITLVFDPEVVNPGSEYGWRMSSLDVARRFADNAMRNGFTYENEFYPASSVLKFVIHEEN